ncbi:MAG: DUF484 family protein [Thiohalomonadaceae bacterium]
MSESRAPALPDNEVEQQLVAYLGSHPDFFLRHQQLLPYLSIPHPVTGGAVSLLERQVGLLREQKLELKHKLQHLAQVARSNEELLEKLQHLILALIDSPSAEAAFDVVEAAMRRDFHADAVVIWTFEDGLPRSIPQEHPQLEALRSIVANRLPVCGQLRPEQTSMVFGRNAPGTASGAFLPLCEGDEAPCFGLIAIGSNDPKRFHAEMGTVFLRHLAAVTARIVRSKAAR